MGDLSVFIDESGDTGSVSRYYLVTLVMHDQRDSVEMRDKAYRIHLANSNLPDLPFHFSPLMNGHGSYAVASLDVRKALLAKFRRFAENLPFKYRTFAYEKSHFESPGSLQEKLSQELTGYLQINLDYFQTFSQIKIYYDNGQSVVTHAIRRAFVKALGDKAVVFRLVDPESFRLFQLADYLCGLELAALKYDRKQQTATDGIFFGGSTAFKKNYLKKIRKKRLG